MKQHIIKRSLSINGGDESILKKGLQWYVMDSVGGTPVGFKESRIGDEVFLYETTSKVVWGRGVIKQKTDLITLQSLIDIIEYSQGISTPSGDAKTAAKQVTSIVNRWEIDRAKLFYLAVRNFHFPKYSLV
jgi:hypothetical protein